MKTGLTAVREYAKEVLDEAYEMLHVENMKQLWLITHKWELASKWDGLSERGSDMHHANDPCEPAYRKVCIIGRVPRTSV